MLDKCKQRLGDIINQKEPVESIFSRSTLRYINEINIMATYNWLNEEYYARHPIPQTILKYDKSADSAIDQIKRKDYPKSLKGFSKKIVLCGINYNKSTSKHEVEMEVIDGV